MGDFARLEAKDGGLFAVDINGVIIRGSYVRLEPPNYIEIAWGEAGTRKCHLGPRVLSFGSKRAAPERYCGLSILGWQRARQRSMRLAGHISSNAFKSSLEVAIPALIPWRVPRPECVLTTPSEGPWLHGC
jgi:hypothetical protein